MVQDPSKLPTEILISIFDQLYKALFYPDKAVQFKECQLVCKAWKSAAQRYLYMDVSFGKSASKFARTIRGKAYLGSHVKRVDFESEFLETRNCYDTLATIIKHCPNIEEINSSESSINEILFPYLLQDSVNLKNLQNIDMFPDIDDKFHDLMAPFLALKFCKTLQFLYVNLNSDSDAVAESRCKFLLNQLKKFTSLQQIQITTMSWFSDKTIDKVLDDCSPTVYYLLIDTFEISPCNMPLNTIKPMDTLKTLRVETSAYFNIPSLRYFSQKFTALEELLIENFEYPQENEEIWWDHFMPICLHLDELELTTNFSKTKLQHQLEKFAELGLKLSNRNTTNNLIIEFDPSAGLNNVLNDVTSGIQFHYKTSNNEISISIMSFIGDLVAYWLKQFVPDKVEISGVANMKDYYSMEFPDEDIKVFLTRISIGRSLQIFINTIQNLGQKKNTSINFDEIILCGIPTALTDVEFAQNSNISQLGFRNSILSEDVFPEISSRLLQLNKLVINACSILMDEPYNLKIFLPSTRLNSLALRLAPFKYATGMCRIFVSDSLNIRNPKLENADLLSAVSLNGHYTLKIETESKIHIIQREGNKSVESNTAKAHGTKDNFLIWIKCFELKEFLVIGEEECFSLQKFESLE